MPKGWQNCGGACRGGGNFSEDLLLLLSFLPSGNNWHRAFCFYPEICIPFRELAVLTVLAGRAHHAVPVRQVLLKFFLRAEAGGYSPPDAFWLFVPVNKIMVDINILPC